MAFGSTRVMGTCAVIGQAIGTGLRFMVQNQLTPKDWPLFIKDLQQQLLREDAYIPGIINEDPNDLARLSTVTASSASPDSYPENVINGFSRIIHDSANCWESNESDESDVSWLNLQLNEATTLTSIEIKFDSNLSKQIMLTMFDNGKADHESDLPTSLIKDYDLELYKDGNLINL